MATHVTMLIIPMCVFRSCVWCVFHYSDQFYIVHSHIMPAATVYF